MGELISIIVPVYNTEKYLTKCITSILEQTYQNIELLLVNDGSTDSSGDICDSFAIMDSRVRVFHTPNAGQGTARNIAIRESKGSLLGFVDSDDYIEKNMYENLYRIVTEKKLDCVICSYQYVNEEEQMLDYAVPQLSDREIVTGNEACRRFLVENTIEGFAWNKLFKKEMFVGANILFNESHKYFEDIPTIYKLLQQGTKIGFLNEKLYNYRQRKVSSVNSLNEQKVNDFYHAIGEVRELAELQGFTKESGSYYSYRMIYQLFDMVKARNEITKEEWKRIKKKLSWNQVFGSSLLKVTKEIVAINQTDRIKQMIKIVIVRVFL